MKSRVLAVALSARTVWRLKFLQQFSLGISSLAVMVLLPACVSPHAAKSQVSVQPQVTQTETRFRKEYVLIPGDQIEVIVRRVPEVSHQVTIRPDGFISLPLLNDVSAAGLTVHELEAKLTTLFAARLLNPEVTVIASKVRDPVVYVAGETNLVAAIPLREAPTAIQAIALAGGFRRSAASRDVTIIRLTEDGHLQAIPVVTEVGGQPGAYMALRSSLLQADDIVFVPENGRSQVTRFLDDIVNKPLVGVSSSLGVYANFKLIKVLQ